MKKYFLIFILSLSGFWYLSAQSLTVRVENVDTGQGYLMVGIFNDETTFPNTDYKGKRVATSDRIVTVTFFDLPVGQYAVSVYQDSNDNGKLDTGLFGVPKEKYGFSSGGRRPNYRDSLFDFNGDQTITILIK